MPFRARTSSIAWDYNIDVREVPVSVERVLAFVTRLDIMGRLQGSPGTLRESKIPAMTSLLSWVAAA